MNVLDIRRRMHLAYADQSPEGLAAEHWPEIKFLLERWDADREAVSQVAIERANAWDEVDRYREQRDRAREANALLAEELAIARGRATRGAACEPEACDSRLGHPPAEECITQVAECDHGRLWLWEGNAWAPLPVEGEPGWTVARIAEEGA
jgi:hypothetical protein